MTSEALDCPFCRPETHRILLESELVLGLWDLYPVTIGHALAVTRRHVANWFEATPAEQQALIDCLAQLRNLIQERHPADGYNIGVNVGQVAGQTVSHVHAHLIPRRLGDTPDPIGGVRNVIPGRGRYRSSVRLASPPHDRALVTGGDDPLLAHLVSHLADTARVDINAAFILETGVRLIEEHLRDVLRRGGTVRVLSGDYLGVTEPNGLLRLLDLRDPERPASFEARIFESNGLSYHPKAYILHCSDGHSVGFVGSSNLSQSALVHGMEWNYRLVTDRDQAGFHQLCAAFEELFRDPRTRPLTPEWIEQYRRRRTVAPVPVVGAALEPPPPPPDPHSVQRDALAALEASRGSGRVRYWVSTRRTSASLTRT
jgi:HKD family nuclease/diadenosine tetraphosphate (Ap4A) HIT family hydrolase